MALCKDCIHNEVCDRLYELNGIPKIGGTDCGCFKDKSDVAPKSEVARDILSDLKKAVHNKAVYSNYRDVESYVNLKVFDAVLNDFIRRYESE